jgi:hypothetical protein
MRVQGENCVDDDAEYAARSLDANAIEETIWKVGAEICGRLDRVAAALSRLAPSPATVTLCGGERWPNLPKAAEGGSEVTDQGHAQGIHDAAADLKSKIEAAYIEGLRVEVDVHEIQEFGMRHPMPLVNVSVSRVTA